MDESLRSESLVSRSDFQYTSITENYKKKGFMENHYMLGYILSVIFGIISLIFLCFLVFQNNKENLDVPKESQIPIIRAFNDTISGAASVYGQNNHIPSPYFKEIDLFNDKPTKTLKILPKFKVYQQTSSYTCGPACALMAMNYLGYTNISEHEIAEEVQCGVPGRLNPHGQLGTSADCLAEFLMNRGFNVEYNSGNNTNPFGNEKGLRDFIINSIENNKPILTMTVDWGGHWEVIIGIDDLGTESTSDDIIILADPYDTTDHRQDGYTIFSLERYYALWGIPLAFSYPGEQTWQYIRVSK